MIVAGPGIPSGTVRRTPVSHVDIYQTALGSVGLEPADDDLGLPGVSLLDICRAEDNPDRSAFSEYHAAASRTGAFMLRKGRFKYVHYLNYTPELYDIDEDPEELINLAGDPDYSENLDGFEAELRDMLDMDEVDSRAKRDQAAWAERHGGEEAILAKPGINATPSPVS